MPSFYHGTSALFDNFDDSKIGKNTAVGNCDNGRGTYLTSDLEWASGWQGRFDGAFYHTKRIDISEDAWDKNFLSQDKVFTRQEAAQLAADAANRGMLGAADTIAHLIRSNARREPEVPALTGRDIAMASRYDAEINHFLHAAGFYGYKYKEEVRAGKEAENVIFFKAADIPLTTPMHAALEGTNGKNTGYKNFVAQGAAVVDTTTLPPAIEKRLENITAQITDYAAAKGIDSSKADAAAADIKKLATLGAAQENYDGRANLHPLKLAETAIVLHMGVDAAKPLARPTADFVHDSMKDMMKDMGHASPAARLESRPASLSGDVSSSRFQMGNDTAAFRKHLENPKYIASETLSSARSQIASEQPQMLASFDKIIDALHAPGVDFSMRDAMGHAVSRALRGQMEPEGGETTIGNLRKNLEYNASSGRADCRQVIDDAASFGERLKAAVQTPAQKPAAAAANTAPATKTTSRFSLS